MSQCPFFATQPCSVRLENVLLPAFIPSDSGNSPSRMNSLSSSQVNRFQVLRLILFWEILVPARQSVFSWTQPIPNPNQQKCAYETTSLAFEGTVAPRNKACCINGTLGIVFHSES